MKVNLPVKLCDFCVGEHLRYQQSLDNFKIGDKVEVATCVCCGKSMCRDCVEASKKRTEGSFLSQDGFYLCADCLQKKWNEGNFKQQSQKIYLKETEVMKEKLGIKLQLAGLQESIIGSVEFLINKKN